MASLISSTTLAPDNGAIAASASARVRKGETVEYDISWVAGATQNLHFQYTGDPTTHWVDIVKLEAVSDASQDVTNGRWTNNTPNDVYVRFIDEETNGSSTDEQITVSADSVADEQALLTEKSAGQAVLREVNDEFRRYYQKLYIGYDGSSNVKLSSTTAESMVRFIFGLNAAGSYGFYTRSYIDTASIDADASRLYATVNNVAATTVRGLHCSLSFGTTGTVSGLGVAAEFTLHINTSGSATGTIAPIKAAINSDGAASDPAGSALSYIQIVNQGNATGMADVDDDADLFDITGHTIGAGNLISAVATAYTVGEITHSARIDIAGTKYYILLSTTAASDT